LDTRYYHILPYFENSQAEKIDGGVLQKKLFDYLQNNQDRLAAQSIANTQDKEIIPIAKILLEAAAQVSIYLNMKDIIKHVMNSMFGENAKEHIQQFS
jgi:hypothetical protein